MSLQTQIDSIKALAVSYQAVIDLAASLEQLASIEQATAEATAALSQATQKRDAAGVELAKVNGLVADAIDKLASVETEALQVKANAKTEAEAIVETAKNQAALIAAECDSHVKDAVKKQKAAELKLSQAQAEIDAKQVELESLVNKIAETKQAALSALGA